MSRRILVPGMHELNISIDNFQFTSMHCLHNKFGYICMSTGVRNGSFQIDIGRPAESAKFPVFRKVNNSISYINFTAL